MSRATTKWIFHWNFGICWPKSPGGPSDDLGRSVGIISSPKFQNPTMLVNHFHIVLFVFWKKQTWKSNFSGIPWTPGPSGPCLCDRSRKKLQTNGIETSVRPNGTPVIPVLRSRKTIKKLFWKFMKIKLFGHPSKTRAYVTVPVR